MATVARSHNGSRLSRLIARFTRARDGATSVEFAIVALPFLTLVFAIIELGLVFFVSVTLENAVIDTGRKIRTGELQTSGGTAATFKTAVCEEMTWVGTACSSALTLDVRTFAGFTASNTAVAANQPQTPCWDPGGPGSVVMVRAYYAWPLITPLLETGLRSSNGKRIVTAVAAFANEPYADTVAPAVVCPVS